MLWQEYIYIYFFPYTQKATLPAALQKKEDRSSNLNCMLISTLLLCVSVLQGTRKTNCWKSLGNSYPITRVLSFTALWEIHTPTLAEEIASSSPLNEFAPMSAYLLLLKTQLSALNVILRGHRLHRQMGRGGFGWKSSDNVGKVSSRVCHMWGTVGTLSLLLSVIENTIHTPRLGKRKITNVSLLFATEHNKLKVDLNVLSKYYDHMEKKDKLRYAFYLLVQGESGESVSER